MTPADLRAARKQLGLTQAQAAALLGVDRVTWTRWENGSRAMSETEWVYFKHKSGLERIPFKPAKQEQKS